MPGDSRARELQLGCDLGRGESKSRRSRSTMPTQASPSRLATMRARLERSCSPAGPSAR
jgi:hypothetical protein